MEAYQAIFIAAALVAAAGIVTITAYLIFQLRRKQKQLAELQEQVNHIEKKVDQEEKKRKG